MVKYICEVCDHIYDPKLDDLGISFDDLPEVWTCPTCGAGRVDFKKED
jgi:rubredoxin